MISEFSVLNYKNIPKLHIGRLGRVNLITGKNNTGKSTLLEALALYKAEGSLAAIASILQERGELHDNRRSQRPNRKNILPALSSLFTDRKYRNGSTKQIYIGERSQTLFGDELDYAEGLFIDLVEVYQEDEEAGPSEFVRRISVVEDDSDYDSAIETEIALRIRSKGAQRLHKLSLPLFDRMFRRPDAGMLVEALQFVKPVSLTSSQTGLLWDQITLTEKEDAVTEGLRIIEPKIDRIAFINDHGYERSTVVRMSNTKQVVPLQSMGDGINRVLSIVLAAVNSETGILLIDEFENGLHHSVQAELWSIIFRLAHSMSFQVFATTHSEDCVRGYEDILNSSSEYSGALVRLEQDANMIRAVDFSKRELQIATDSDIETR